MNKAQRIWRYHEVRGEDTVCVDQKGRMCRIGKHFMVARDEGAFPIDVYLLREDMLPNDGGKPRERSEVERTLA